MSADALSADEVCTRRPGLEPQSCAGKLEKRRARNVECMRGAEHWEVGTWKRRGSRTRVAASIRGQRRALSRRQAHARSSNEQRARTRKAGEVHTAQTHKESNTAKYRPHLDLSSPLTPVVMTFLNSESGLGKRRCIGIGIVTDFDKGRVIVVVER